MDAEEEEEDDEVEENDVEEEDRSQDWEAHFVRAGAIEMHTDISQYAYPAASVLREPVQSKCTWTCHKRHFVQKFTGKMPDASDTTSIGHRALP